MLKISKTKTREEDVRQMKDMTLIVRSEKLPVRNVGGAGFVVHSSFVLLVDSHEILSLRLASSVSTLPAHCYAAETRLDTVTTSRKPWTNHETFERCLLK